MVNINLITTGFQKSGRIVSAIRNSSHRFDDIHCGMITWRVCMSRSISLCHGGNDSVPPSRPCPMRYRQHGLNSFLDNLRCASINLMWRRSKAPSRAGPTSRRLTTTAPARGQSDPAPTVPYALTAGTASPLRDAPSACAPRAHRASGRLDTIWDAQILGSPFGVYSGPIHRHYPHGTRHYYGNFGHGR
jgi:hypothetical protein